METMEQQIYCPKAYNPLTFFAIIALVTLIGYFFSACTGSAKPAANSSGTSLDMAIAEAAGRMETRLNVGTKIALINFSSSSAQFSEYVLEGISLHLVNGGKLVVVDRANLDRVRQEQGFQLSGDVSDESAKAIGQMLGADAIVTGSLTNIGREYRINLKAITVEAATVAVQYAADIAADERVRTLLASGGGSGGGTTAFSESRTSGSGTGQTQTVQIPSQSTAQTSAQSKVIIVEGASLAEKLQWIEANAANDTEYRVEVTANESLSAPVLSYPRRRYVTIRLISNGGEKVLSLTGSGSIFTIESDVTLILDNGITLQGRKGNNASLVTVNSRGTLVMNEGAKISSNTNSDDGGGVYVNANGTFTMTGGEISDNTVSFGAGGGVYVAEGGIFTMTDGEIYDNKITQSKGNGGGGGVQVRGLFTMRGGKISGNTTSNSSGGGVCVWFRATFTMEGGEISGNDAGYGGGVYYYLAYGQSGSTFAKTGGTIYGDTGTSNGNRAAEGNAVYCSIHNNLRLRNSTAGTNVKLDSSKAGAAGGWEN